MIKKNLLFSVLLLLIGVCSIQAQEFTKWKIVEDPASLKADDVVVVVDLTSSTAMTNNPKYEENNTVSKESPSAAKVTLKEELDRISSEVADTIVWTMKRPSDTQYSLYFLNEESKTRYMFNSDQNLRVGFVSEDNASKRNFDIDKGLFHMKIQTDENIYTDYHVGMKAASGIMAMMGGNTWELAADAEGEVSSDIAATKMAFFKKVVTSLPDPTLTFPKHDYEADVQNPSDFESPVATVVEGGDIIYYSGNTDLAEVDDKTGAVTLKKRGTVRIYAYVKATATCDDYLTSYVLRIDDSEAAGGRNHPFSVAEAIAYAKEDHAEEAANGVCYFVKGIVSSVGGAMAGMEGMEDMMEMMSGMMEGMEGMEGFDMSSMLSMFMGEQEPGTVTYAISANGVDRDSLSIINGRGLQLVDITEDSLSVGDEVTVYGPLEYSEDNDMMSMMGGMGGNGNNQEKKKSVKMPRVNYMQEHERNLITKDIILYFQQTKAPDDLYSITKTFGGTQIMAETTLNPSDKEVADWVVNGTDSLLTPKKEGIITITVKAPVLLAEGDTIKMRRKFIVDVRDRELPAAGSMVGNYELVTDASQLSAGDKLIIVATIDEKSKVLVKSSGSSGGMMGMFGGGSNAKNITINDDGKITEIPDDTQLLTLEEDGDKWRLQTGKTADGNMTYLYISDTDGGGNSMIPGMGSSGASLKTGTYTAIGDSCQVAFTFLPEKNDSVKIQFNFADREKDGNPVKAKNVIRYEKGTMSTSFGGYEPDNDKATLPRLYKMIQADQYDVTITDALWATIVSFYDVTLPTGVTGYVATVVDNNTVTLEEVTSLKGGEPYLLKSEAAGDYTLSRAAETVAEPAKNLLEVSDNGTDNGVYVLANGSQGPAFYKWMGGKLGAGRVYLPAPSGTSGAPAFLSFAFGDVTEVRGVKDVSADNADRWYDLQGRRVTKPSNGLYIVNGKTVLVK